MKVEDTDIKVDEMVATKISGVPREIIQLLHIRCIDCRKSKQIKKGGGGGGGEGGGQASYCICLISIWKKKKKKTFQAGCQILP